jgi:hypothetical protein
VRVERKTVNCSQLDATLPATASIDVSGSVSQRNTFNSVFERHKFSTVDAGPNAVPTETVDIRVAGQVHGVAISVVGFALAFQVSSGSMPVSHITMGSTGRGVTFRPATPGWLLGRAG